MSARQRVDVSLDERVWREAQKAAIDNKVPASTFINSTLNAKLQLGTLPEVTPVSIANKKVATLNLEEEVWREMRKLAIDHGFSPHDLINAILSEKLGVK